MAVSNPNIGKSQPGRTVLRGKGREKGGAKKGPH